MEGRGLRITITSPQNNYYRQKLSELAQIYYEKLVSQCMKSSLYSIKDVRMSYYRSFLALVNRFREIHNLFEYCSYGEQDL